MFDLWRNGDGMTYLMRGDRIEETVDANLNGITKIEIPVCHCHCRQSSTSPIRNSLGVGSAAGARQQLGENAA